MVVETYRSETYKGVRITVHLLKDHFYYLLDGNEVGYCKTKELALFAARKEVDEMEGK